MPRLSIGSENQSTGRYILRKTATFWLKVVKTTGPNPMRLTLVVLYFFLAGLMSFVTGTMVNLLTIILCSGARVSQCRV